MVDNPQRVLRQLGYDEGVVPTNDDISYNSALGIENRFVTEGRKEVLMALRGYFVQDWKTRV